MSTLDFSAFFEEVHGLPPLPWQRRLAEQLLSRHLWPDLIDLPTASGKTACIDIAVFYLAHCALLGEPWRASRRIVFIVDRRIIVDAAFERAVTISGALSDPRGPATTAVAAALRRLSGSDPLCCLKLRGGMPRERGFALDPTQPMIITSTIDQIGSRLLFRGYGMSPFSYSLHAGLLAYDTLILLDEAHLGRPFMGTLSAIRREQSRAQWPVGPVQPVQWVPLSATAQVSGEAFCLSDVDFANPVIAERRAARKPARLVQTTSKVAERLDVLFQQTLAVHSSFGTPAPSVVVIVNRVRTARTVFERLRSRAGEEFDVKLMTGRSRPLDRDALEKDLLARVRAGRKPLPEDRGLIVVATQTIEVGADLDFQGLVTECAALDSLRQRFGRLDRLGRFGLARAVIVGGGEAEDDPIYGGAVARTWNWLNRIATPVDGAAAVDFSIEAMEAAVRSVDLQSLASPQRESLALTPTHVELLCQTAPTPMYDPDVSAFLHGLESSKPDIQVIWRDYIPTLERAEQPLIDGTEGRLVNDLLTILPPSSLETLALPLSSLRSWLEGSDSGRDLTDVEGIRTVDDDVQTSKRAAVRDVWRRSSQGWDPVSPRKLRPGDTVVVPSVYGGCDEFGFAPSYTGPVSDLSQAARRKLGQQSVRLLTEDNLLSSDVENRTQRVKEAWAALQQAASSERASPQELPDVLLEALGFASTADAGWVGDCTETLASGEGSPYALVLRSGRPGVEDISEEDLSSSRTVPVSLSEHNEGVGRRARSIAKLIGLEGELSESVGTAGDVHDLGKADPRFQRLLRSGDETTWAGELLAKGLRGGRAASVELGERHEAYSVAILRMHPTLLKSAPDAELAQYLVGTHHGRGRALMPAVIDEGARFTVTANGETLHFEGLPALGDVGSGWPSLFWRLCRRYGPWGLAYLESIVRLADHLQSRDEMARKCGHA